MGTTGGSFQTGRSKRLTVSPDQANLHPVVNRLNGFHPARRQSLESLCSMPSFSAALNTAAVRRRSASQTVTFRRGCLALAGAIALLGDLAATDAHAGMIFNAESFADSDSSNASSSAPARRTQTSSKGNQVAVMLASGAAEGAGAAPGCTSSGQYLSPAPPQACQLQMPNPQSWLACEQGLQLPPSPLFDRLRPPRHF